jgi:hypothetical protein
LRFRRCCRRGEGGGAACLFLSHAGIDGAAAVALVERIERSPEARRHGLTTRVDQRAGGLQPGTPWQDHLEVAIRRSTAGDRSTASQKTVEAIRAGAIAPANPEMARARPDFRGWLRNRIPAQTKTM